MFPGMGNLPPLWATCAFTTLTVKIRLILAGIKEAILQLVISKLAFEKDKMNISL